MVFDLPNDRIQILWFDYSAELNPARPETRENVQGFNEEFPCLLATLLLFENQDKQIQVYSAGQLIQIVKLFQLSVQQMDLWVHWGFVSRSF